jgi:hypothetical protein
VARPFDRGPGERFLAWLYTGPLGHLYGAVVDIVSIWAEVAVDRLRAARRK